MAEQNMDLDMIQLLINDHELVKSLHEQFQRESDLEKRQALADEICVQLLIHDQVELKMLYPQVEMVDKSLNDLSHQQHDMVRAQLMKLKEMKIQDQHFVEMLNSCVRDVLEHVEIEEKQIFPKLREAIDQSKLLEFGRQAKELKKSLTEELQGSGSLSGRKRERGEGEQQEQQHHTSSDMHQDKPEDEEDRASSDSRGESDGNGDRDAPPKTRGAGRKKGGSSEGQEGHAAKRREVEKDEEAPASRTRASTRKKQEA